MPSWHAVPLVELCSLVAGLTLTSPITEQQCATYTFSQGPVRSLPVHASPQRHLGQPLCRWDEDSPDAADDDIRQRSVDWLSGVFEAAHQEAQRAIDFMCSFIGMKVRASAAPCCISVSRASPCSWRPVQPGWHAGGGPSRAALRCAASRQHTHVLQRLVTGDVLRAWVGETIWCRHTSNAPELRWLNADMQMCYDGEQWLGLSSARPGACLQCLVSLPCLTFTGLSPCASLYFWTEATLLLQQL